MKIHSTKFLLSCKKELQRLGVFQSLCKPSNLCKIELLSLEVLFYGKKKKRKPTESSNEKNDARIFEI